MKKKTLSAIIGCAVVTAVAATYLTIPTPPKKETRTVNYMYLDQNKKVLQKVDYETFRSNLDSGKLVIKMPEQDSFLEELVYALNNDPAIAPEYGFNFSRDIDKKEFEIFIFDYILGEKLGFEIKTPTDVLVGINMALEHLARYNKRMIMDHRGLGSDIDGDGRFDGVSWSALKEAGWAARVEIMKNIEEAESVASIIAREENNRTDGSATDYLLIAGDGDPNAVEVVCRNYMSALKIMFDTAKERYPELTKNVELVQMLEPGHVFGAFINKKNLQYMVVDPTWHDNDGKFTMGNFTYTKDKDYHYDCLQDPNYFEYLEVDTMLFDYWDTQGGELIFHKESKKKMEKLLLKTQELVKKYPKSAGVANLEIMVYLNFGDGKENYKKTFEMLKTVYDDKDRKELLGTREHSLLLLCLGEIAYELEEYEKGIPFFEECFKFRVADNSFVDEAMLSIAESHLKLENYYEAMFRAKDILEFSPRYHKEARNIVKKSANHLLSTENNIKELEEAFQDYIKGDYEKVLEKLNDNDSQSKLFKAESHAALKHYKEAKSLYEEVIEEDRDFSKLAKTELAKMNRKFFLYGYTHFFDNKFGTALEEFEFLKSNITPEDGIAKKMSYLMMYTYTYTGSPDKAVAEGDYFLKTFPEDKEYKKYVEEYLKELKARMAEESPT